MYAVIETGGKQYKVQEGDVLFIEKLANEKVPQSLSTKLWPFQRMTR